MKLVSMKNEKDGEEDYTPSNYTLSLYLNQEQCEALGITSAPEPGTQYTISAKAIASSASANVDPDGDAKNEVSLCLQITDLGLTAVGVARNAASILYGSE